MKVAVAWMLGEEARGPAQDVGAEQALDGIEDPTVADDVVHPGEQKVAPGVGAPRDPAALARLERRETLLAGADLRVGEDVDRRDEAVSSEGFDPVWR